MSTQRFGERVPRLNDAKLLRGQGCYVDDVPLPGGYHAVFLRSPFARARILSIDASAAREHPSVAAVYTCDDLGPLDQPLPMLSPHPAIIAARTQRPLARDEVFHVGQTVAMVIAVDRYTAEDALRLIDADYEPLPVTVDLANAAAPGAHPVHPDLTDNIVGHLAQRSGDPGGAFAKAEHVTSLRVRMDRSTAAPIETRAIAARWEAATGELTVWDTTQAPISIRDGLASILGLEENKLRVIAPDVGGGFGQKVMLFYPEEILVPWAAMRLARPVKYVEDRTENFIGSSHERTQIHEIQLAATKDGTVIGLKDSFLHDSGAFAPYGIEVPRVSASAIAGPYRIPNVDVEFKAIYTPTVPVTPFRGSGRPHACFALERAMDQLADELGLDRFELRRRNLIGPDEFPYVREGLKYVDDGTITYDSGQYPKALAMIEEAIDLERFRREKDAAAKEGRYLGLGLAFYMECTGLGPYDGCRIRIHPATGKVSVNTGLASQGQGHETVFAQIAADRLGVPIEDVIVAQGDTAAFDRGGGSHSSRSAVVGGNAVHKAAVRVRAQILETAARLMAVPEESLELADGRVTVKGANRFMTLAEIAIAANPLSSPFDRPAEVVSQYGTAGQELVTVGEGRAPGIEASAYYSPSASPWAYGVHAAIVEVDPDLCSIAFKRYLSVHDCGKMINPTIVEGQMIGGIAQGIGGAFYERLDYDEDGIITNASFMEFLMPYATEVPKIEIMHLETPSPANPLGIKGAGEAGTIAVPAVVASAVEDALKPLGVGRFHHAPLSPNMIFEAITRARAKAGG
ncbi:MAG: xanthine dehydrogenase family protein molybdopterin-binding subunit [Alphaproteobacteria bacterium]